MPFSAPATIRAIWVSQGADSKVSAHVESHPFQELPPGDVTIRVAYSSLNYKDALAATADPRVIKKLPHVPGIDAAGTVVECASHRFTTGQEVVVTGFNLGVGTWGGYSEYIRVPAEWVMPLPAGLSMRDAMAYGTAGLAAAMCVDALVDQEVKPGDGEVVVTGASGGVGSIAVGILAKLGYAVAAVSGKQSARAMLERLGARRVLDRNDVDERSDRPMLSAHWSGGVDTVGGNILGTLLRSLKPGGCVAACGVVGGAVLPITVYPFILRGCTLCGIDTVWTPMEERTEIWRKLAAEWRFPELESLLTEISLDALPSYIPKILAGHITGRVIVRV